MNPSVLISDMAVTSDAKMKIKRVDSAESDVGVQLDPKELDEFLHAIRRKFRHKINREGCAPHYPYSTINITTLTVYPPSPFPSLLCLSQTFPNHLKRSRTSLFDQFS